MKTYAITGFTGLLLLLAAGCGQNDDAILSFPKYTKKVTKKIRAKIEQPTNLNGVSNYWFTFTDKTAGAFSFKEWITYEIGDSITFDPIVH